MDIKRYPYTPRLVNRFSLGADPEFTFANASGKYQYAENFGMNTLQACGCDMSGRQAELRPYPSKFALEVVASMLDELRWMTVAFPETVACNWMAVPYNGVDGCGGHIHFGRQHSKRKQDVVVMDAVTGQLLSSGVLDKYQFLARKDARGGYGKLGDFRIQKHGFEYRTLPTQLSNPWLTYFTLVISKLAVYEGAVTFPAKWVSLLEHYADRDDDAAIALKAYKRLGAPIEYSCDFKLLWGIAGKPLERPKGLYIPSVIRAEAETCNELFNYLVHGQPLPYRLPIPTWKPVYVTAPFSPATIRPHTLHHAPNTVMDIVARNFTFEVAVGTPELVVPEHANVNKKAIAQALSDLDNGHRYQVTFYKGNGFIIYISRAMNKSLVACNKLNDLLSTPALFPTCKADVMHEVDWSRWDKKVDTRTQEFKGKEIGVYAAPKPKPNLRSYSYAAQLQPPLLHQDVMDLIQAANAAMQPQVVPVEPPPPNPKPRKRRPIPEEEDF